jgi:hypothetical protein
MAAPNLVEEYAAHLIAIPKACNPTRDRTRADRNDLLRSLRCTAQIVHVFIGPHTAADQKDIDIWYVMSRDDQRHIYQPVLVHPLTSIEQGDFAPCAARKLQDGKSRQFT